MAVHPTYYTCNCTNIPVFCTFPAVTAVFIITLYVKSLPAIIAESVANSICELLVDCFLTHADWGVDLHVGFSYHLVPSSFGGLQRELATFIHCNWGVVLHAISPYHFMASSFEACKMSSLGQRNSWLHPSIEMGLLRKHVYRSLQLSQFMLSYVALQM